MDGFKRLEELGSKTIASDTHIPIANVEKILNREYDKLQKPQFFGFLSILEREYKIDLSSLKQEYLFSRAEEEISEESFDIGETGSKLLEQRKEIFKNKKVLYGVVGSVVVLFLIILLSSLDFSSEKEAKIEINNTAIDKAKKNLNLEPVHVSNVEEAMKNNDVESAEFGQKMEDESAKGHKNESKSATTPKAVEEIDAKEPVSSTEPTMPLYLRIVPKGRLWLGLVDGETYRRRVETISKPLILDPEKSWLIVTGYGHLDLDCGDTTIKFREDRKLLLLYEAGVCQEIDKEEFKARNRGKLW